jgi:hypothetical protein
MAHSMREETARKAPIKTNLNLREDFQVIGLTFAAADGQNLERITFIRAQTQASQMLGKIVAAFVDHPVTK